MGSVDVDDIIARGEHAYVFQRRCMPHGMGRYRYFIGQHRPCVADACGRLLRPGVAVGFYFTEAFERAPYRAVGIDGVGIEYYDFLFAHFGFG